MSWMKKWIELTGLAAPREQSSNQKQMICFCAAVLAEINGIDWRGIALLFGGLRAAASRRQPAKREDKRPDNSRSLPSLFSIWFVFMKWNQSNWEKRRREGRASQTTNKRKREAALKLFLLVGYGRWPSCSAPIPFHFFQQKKFHFMLLALSFFLHPINQRSELVDWKDGRREWERERHTPPQQPTKRGNPTLSLCLVCLLAKNMRTVIEFELKDKEKLKWNERRGNGEELETKTITFHSVIKEKFTFLYEGSNSIQPFPPFHSTH